MKFLKFDLNYSQLLPTNINQVRFAVLRVVFRLYVTSPYEKNITTITKYVKVHVIRTNKLTYIYDFIDQKTTHKQTNLNRKNIFQVRAHQDIFDNLFFQKFNNATLSLKTYMIYLSNQRKQLEYQLVYIPYLK
ncbi:unnamed protein product [Paramecium pentaurelia]|uniref:Uncharacterized protein n=1 Tax=Paramecium pentaurelia TaxID=43138 RepID=A0A8S1UKG4_9CILI|nr:unnamed protein product [Paramecium pentaurelia]